MSDLEKRLSKYQPGRWFRCFTIEEMQAFYLSRLPAIREAAKECGYAIGLHGSTCRDMDLMAFPWIEDHASKDALAKAIHIAACGISSLCYEWEYKPYARAATSFPICWPEWQGMRGAGHIDLSVVDVDLQGQQDRKERT